MPFLFQNKPVYHNMHYEGKCVSLTYKSQFLLISPTHHHNEKDSVYQTPALVGNMRHSAPCCSVQRLHEGVEQLRAWTCVNPSAPPQHRPSRHVYIIQSRQNKPFLYLVWTSAAYMHTAPYTAVQRTTGSASPQLCPALLFLCTHRTCPQRCFPRALPGADWSARRANERARPAEAGLPATAALLTDCLPNTGLSPASKFVS